MTGADLQNLIRLELTKLGYVVFRANVGKVRLADGRFFDTGLPKGFSDIFAIKDGLISFIEVKGKGDRKRPEQENFIEQMQKRGCKAGFAYSLDDALKILKEI